MLEIFSLLISSDVMLATSQNSILAANNVYDLKTMIRVGVSVVVLVSGFLAAAFIIWWAVLMILSGGKEDKMKTAVNMMRYAVIGLFLIILLLFLVPKIGDIIGIPLSDYISPRSIFETIQSISSRVINSGSPTPYYPSGWVDDFDPSLYTDLP